MHHFHLILHLLPVFCMDYSTSLNLSICSMACKKAQLQIFREQALCAIQPHATIFSNSWGAICVTPTTDSRIPLTCVHPNFVISITSGTCWSPQCQSMSCRCAGRKCWCATLSVGGRDLIFVESFEKTLYLSSHSVGLVADPYSKLWKCWSTWCSSLRVNRISKAL